MSTDPVPYTDHPFVRHAVDQIHRAFDLARSLPAAKRRQFIGDLVGDLLAIPNWAATTQALEAQVQALLLSVIEIAEPHAVYEMAQRALRTQFDTIEALHGNGFALEAVAS